MSCTSKTTSLGRPVVQNLARDTERIVNTTDTPGEAKATEPCMESNHRPQFK
jgi:hypothetical protein